MKPRNGSPLPGLSLSLGYSVTYLSLLVLIPLSACFITAASLSPTEFWNIVWSERTRAAYSLTFTTAFIAALINAVIGFLVAWVLVRYEFPFKRLVDAMIDLPLALPTAVAGLVYSSLYVESGWLGQYLVPLGINAAYTKFAIVWVLVFTGFPFVVRTVQPVLEEIEPEVEEAAAILGASRLQVFLRILLPTIFPAILSGFAQAFARGLGEYGSVIFVSSNIPYKTELAPVLIVTRLEEMAFPEATAIATILLIASFLLLAFINTIEIWSKRLGK
ncbi:MAG: sulfate ABC transporter permease subunit CysT [Gemmataceae bacterium]|nr:sulfate ABC transporter permease subunit CysT [Gemmataceae bacterium]